MFTARGQALRNPGRRDGVATVSCNNYLYRRQGMILDNRCHRLRARVSCKRDNPLDRRIRFIEKDLFENKTSRLLRRGKKLGRVSRLQRSQGQHPTNDDFMPRYCFSFLLFPFFFQTLNFIDRERASLGSIGVSSFSPRKISIDGSCNQI